MNADIIGGAAITAASATALISWATCAVRRRIRPATPTPVETPQPPTFTTIDFTVGDDTYTFATDHPVQPDDLQAVFVCLVHSRGPVDALTGVISLIEATAAAEATTLDDDLAALTDGGQR